MYVCDYINCKDGDHMEFVNANPKQETCKMKTCSFYDEDWLLNCKNFSVSSDLNSCPGYHGGGEIPIMIKKSIKMVSDAQVFLEMAHDCVNLAHEGQDRYNSRVRTQEENTSLLNAYNAAMNTCFSIKRYLLTKSKI